MGWVRIACTPIVIGEHGDSQVPVLSSARIAGLPLEGLCQELDLPYDEDALKNIANDTRMAGLEIVRAKGATYYGIGAALVRIVAAILRDEHAMLTVSTLASASMDLGEVSLSLPAIINREGVARVLAIALDQTEKQALQASAEILKKHSGTLDCSKGIVA